MRRSLAASSLLLAAQLVAGCGDPSPARPAQMDMAPAAARGTLRVEARALYTNQPVAGVAVAIDHAGGRIEATTDANGNATVAAPDWDAGPVDVTYGGAPAIMLTSLLGVARGETLTLGLPVRYTGQARTLSGTIVNKLAAGDDTILTTDLSGDYFQGSATTYQLKVPPTGAGRMIGAEFNSPDPSTNLPPLAGHAIVQTFVKWFSLPVPDGAKTLDVDVTAAEALTPTKLTGTVMLPGGANGPFAKGTGYVAMTQTGGTAFIGAMTRVDGAADGASFHWEGEYVTPTGMTPYVQIQLRAGPNGAFSAKRFVGAPSDGQVVSDLLPMPELTSPRNNASSHPIGSPIVFAQVASGIDSTGVEIFKGRASVWRVYALDKRASITVPAQPTGVDVLGAAPVASVFFCADTAPMNAGCGRIATAPQFDLDR